MDKLQKIGAWLWLYKERLIFIVMIGLLVQRVYIVIYPPEYAVAGPLPPVQQAVPPELKPPMLPQPPTLERETVYPEITKGNIFWKDAGSGSSSSGGTEAPKVTLLNVVNDTNAQLKTPSSRSTFKKVGDEFDGYRLESLDRANQSVVVTEISTGQRLTLTK